MLKHHKLIVSVACTLVALIGLGIFFATSDAESAPAYESSKAQVLLSNKVDKLNDDQESAFYTLAQRACKLATKGDGSNWDNFEPVSLYVEKTKAKHAYQIAYMISPKNNQAIQIEYDLTLILDDNKLDDGQGAFHYKDFNLNLGK